jgi:hypothetical protein
MSWSPRSSSVPRLYMTRWDQPNQRTRAVRLEASDSHTPRDVDTG